MGPNANLNVVARVLEALDAVLQPA